MGGDLEDPSEDLPSSKKTVKVDAIDISDDTEENDTELAEKNKSNAEFIANLKPKAKGTSASKAKPAKAEGKATEATKAVKGKVVSS